MKCIAILGVAGVLAVTSAAGAFAAPALPVDGAVTDPDWERRPTGDDMARVYPRFAMIVGMSGQVTLVCTVTAAGAVQGCRVETEAPVGLGFGQAGLALAPLFRMKPRMVDGVPTGGAQIRIPIRFSNDPDPLRADPGPRIDPRLLDLGRRLAVARGDADAFSSAANAAVSGIRSVLGEPGLSPEARTVRAALLDIFDEQRTAMRDAFVGRLAADYAGQFSEAELNALIAFYATPAGKAWAAKSGALENAALAALRLSLEDASFATGKAYCAANPCPGQSPAPSAAAPSTSLPIDTSP